MDKFLLETKGLNLFLKSRNGNYQFLRDINLKINKGECVAVVGESGSGKTLLSHSLIRLNPKNSVISGEILFHKENFLEFSNKRIREIRGNTIGMVFQEPYTCFNPVYTIGQQMKETLKCHKKLTNDEIYKIQIDVLEKLSFWDPEKILDMYPHQFSGGMIQRAMIAQCLMLKPKLLIADEPATALDITTQKHILELLQKLINDEKMALLLITHNFGIIHDITSWVYVMYAGSIVEEGPTEDLIRNPLHPYTKGLLKAIPSLLKEGEELVSIPGLPPEPGYEMKECPFLRRCNYKKDICSEKFPELKGHGKERKIRCFFYE